jgi:hypothetical protein
MVKSEKIPNKKPVSEKELTTIRSNQTGTELNLFK